MDLLLSRAGWALSYRCCTFSRNTPTSDFKGESIFSAARLEEISCRGLQWYYWEKALLLIVKNVGARDYSVRLYMSSNLFLDTGVCYLFKLVGGGVFENICGE